MNRSSVRQKVVLLPHYKAELGNYFAFVPLA